MTTQKLFSHIKIIVSILILLHADLTLAVGADDLSAGVTTAEGILTGSFMRLIVIAGSIFGVIKAYMASSPLLMGGSIAIGIGINLLMTWVKATWPILI